jgi:hypothetical protein
MAKVRMTGRGRRRESRPDCVFCRIVTGQAPSSAVLEDGRVLAFMDTSPVRRGHVLVIPKPHRAQIWDMSDAEFAAVYRMLPTLVRALARATGADAVNILSLNGRPCGARAAASPSSSSSNPHLGLPSTASPAASVAISRAHDRPGAQARCDKADRVGETLRRGGP